MMNPAMFRAMALRGGMPQRPLGPVPTPNPNGGAMPAQPQTMGGMMPPAQTPFRSPVGPSMAPPNNFNQSGLQGFGMGNRGAY